MCASLCLLINIILASLSYLKHRTLLAPTFIINVMWGLSNLMNLSLGWNSNEPEYLILIIPSLMFSIGFLFTNLSYSSNLGLDGIVRNFSFTSCDFEFNEKAIRILIVGSYVVSIAYFWFVYRNIQKHYTGSLWYTLRLITWLEDGASSAIFTYPIIPIFILPTILIYQYKITGKKKYRIIVSIVIALLWAIFYSSRTPIFTFVVLTLFGQLLCSIKPRRLEKRKRKRVVVFSALFILIMFIYGALQKNGDLYGDVGIASFAIKSLINYTNLSSACFVEWIKSDVTRMHGAISFRFIFAILARLGMNVQVLDTSSGGLFIEFNGFQTNAFTVARNYVQDFGVVYMAVMLFLFGIIHGLLYKRATEYGSCPIKLRFIVSCSALYVPAFYQILTDQYMNCLSLWLQYYLWSIIFTSSVFIRRRADVSCKDL